MNSAPRMASRPVTTLIRARDGWFDFGLDEVWKYRELLYFLVWRDVKVRYAQAALGTAWAVVQPIVAAIIFTVIFGLFAKLPSDGHPYPLFAFAALLPWTYFSEAVRRSSLGLVGDGELIKKVYFPRLIIPVANMATPLIDFVLTLLPLFGLMLWYGVAPSMNIIALPMMLALSGALALAIALWLGPLNVRFRDVTHTLPFLLQVWMYATPIVYPLSMVPERFKLLYSLNPTVGLIEGFRWCLLGTGTLDVRALGISALITVVLLASGMVAFRRAEPRLVDLL